MFIGAFWALNSKGAMASTCLSQCACAKEALQGPVNQEGVLDVLLDDPRSVSLGSHTGSHFLAGSSTHKSTIDLAARQGVLTRDLRKPPQLDRPPNPKISKKSQKSVKSDE
eukprot:547671-Amphidinium_carterae.1